MLLVSVKTSLIAAQIASVSTVMISSTTSWHILNVSLPTSFTAVPSEKRPTSFNSTRFPAFNERFIASESTVCTPIILISGRIAFIYAPIPAINPPPPMATKIASMGP